MRTIVDDILAARARGIRRVTVSLPDPGPVAYLPCICPNCVSYQDCTRVVNAEGVPYPKGARGYFPDQRLPQSEKDCVQFVRKKLDWGPHDFDVAVAIEVLCLEYQEKGTRVLDASDEYERLVLRLLLVSPDRVVVRIERDGNVLIHSFRPGHPLSE